MARPQILAWIRHGKLITGKLYPTFVETWNWIVRSWSSLKGDGDMNNRVGFINVDRSDDDHPVIRLRVDKLLALLKSKQTATLFPFEIQDGVLINRYYRVEQKLFEADPYTITSADAGHVLWVQADYSSSSAVPGGTVSIESGTLSGFNTNAASPLLSVCPLYLLDENAKVAVDFRAIPTMQQWMTTVTVPSED